MVTKEDVYQQMKAHRLSQVIRGEICAFRTPPDVNAELLPTDHFQLLVQALYPLSIEVGSTYVQRELDLALRVAATDALGVFCAIRCYFMQIMNEDDGKACFSLDRISLPQFLTSRYFALAEDLKSLVMAEQSDVPGYGQRMALRYLTTLREKHHVQLTVD